MTIGPVDYALNSVPQGYLCHQCGTTGVRLWAEHSSMGGPLLLECASCAEEGQKPVHGKGWKSEFSKGTGMVIGWRVPAIPCKEGSACWAWGSVPEEGWQWWSQLPTTAPVQIRRQGLTAARDEQLGSVFRGDGDWRDPGSP